MSEEEQEGLPEHLLLLALTYAAAGAELYVGGGAGGAAGASAAPGRPGAVGRNHLLQRGGQLSHAGRVRAEPHQGECPVKW
jgi:hypothetical protein